MNKKTIGIAITILTLSLMIVPLVIAKPGAPKNNENFLYFELVPSGTTGEPGKQWYTPPEPADPKTSHVRDGTWIPGTLLTLTIGENTYPDDDPLVTLVYSATYAADTLINDDGNAVNVRVTDVVTISYDGEELGTLELSIKSKSTSTGYGGTVVGHGTGYFKDVKISAVDQVVLEPSFHLARIGTIQGWPGFP